MSLATRCSSCGTAFRVVQDQLKVSEGWVRCGHCGEVFDALEGLFDLERADTSGWDTGGADLSVEQRLDGPADRERARPEGLDPTALSTPAGPMSSDLVDAGPTAPDAQAAAPPSASGETSAAPFFVDPGRPALPSGADVEPTGSPEVEPPASPRRDDDPIDAHLFGGRRSERRRHVTAQAWDRDQPDFSDARYDSDLAPDAADGDDPAVADATRVADGAPLDSAAAEPDFVRRAEHQARWERPGVRLGLAGAALLAVLVLMLQGVHHFRDDVAARWQSTQPALGAWCGLVDCTIDPPRRIEQVSVESTALARAPGSSAFRLAVALRNRAATPIAAPSLDLTLTDAGGRLVARRALAPQELTPPVTRLMPGAEIVLQAVLETGDPRISGYTVEIFYP